MVRHIIIIQIIIITVYSEVLDLSSLPNKSFKKKKKKKKKEKKRKATK